MMRFVLMQICPWCKKRPMMAMSTARPRSASSSTTSGQLPPSSSATRLRRMPPAVFAPMPRPTSVDPVNEMSLGTGCSTK